MELIYTALNESDLALVRGLTHAGKTLFMAHYCNYSLYPTLIIMNDESPASYNRTLDIGNVSGLSFNVVFDSDTNLESLLQRYCDTKGPQQIIVDNISGINGSTIKKGLNIVAKVYIF